MSDLVCAHDTLSRQCEICALLNEVRELQAEVARLAKIETAAQSARELHYYPDRDDGIIASATHKLLDDILAGRGPKDAP